MIEILNPTELARAKDTGALVADILQKLQSRSTIGTSLLDIDRWAETMIIEAGAQSCYFDYEPSFGRGPFGHYICTAVNDAVLHGLPSDYTLADGDLLTLDLAVCQGGVAADAAISFIVGESKPPESVAMISATERALSAGIAAAEPGARIGDVSHAIGSVLSEAGYPINTEFGGHGIGSTMHQDPHVSNTGRPGRGYKLRPGLLLALEPWVMADTAELVTDADGWTLRSATGCRTAHSEHTIAITNDGAEVLTLPKQAATGGGGVPPADSLRTERLFRASPPRVRPRNPVRSEPGRHLGWPACQSPVTR
jgi:methionyl aminopeptidase